MAYSSEDTLTGERMKKTLVLVGMDRNLQFNYYAGLYLCFGLKILDMTNV